MDTTVMLEWLIESLVPSSPRTGRQKVLFSDNCSGHARTKEMVEGAKGLTLSYFTSLEMRLI